MQQALIPTERQQQELINMVLDGLDSPNSKRAYLRALHDFLTWYALQGRPGLTKRTVQRFKAFLQERGLAPSTINLKLSAIRKLALEAADNNLLDPNIAAGIGRVKGVKMHGVRLGNWLEKEQAQALKDAPDLDSVKGLRDRALLSVLIGCALRRSEAAALTFDHLQQRKGRWVIVDLVGKHNHIRHVPVPSWAKAAIDDWAEAAGIYEGYIFRSMRKGDHVLNNPMTAQAIRDIVPTYAEALGLEDIAPHDLRRTGAQLAYNGGSDLKQIQLFLGHQSIKTTERYLNVAQDFTDAPCDRMGLH